MSDRKVLITETRLEDIGDAIRGRNGLQTTYTPGQMPAAIEAIPNAYAAGDEGKVVSNGALVSQTSRSVDANGTYDTTTNDEVTVNIPGTPTLVSKTITENGVYDPADDSADGYSGVTVNVSGGGGAALSQKEARFVNNYARNGLEIRSVSASGDISLETARSEYYDYVYGRSNVIADLGLVLLGDFSQGGSASGNRLSGSIADYSGVLLQGVYSKNRTSQYNTTYMYCVPALNTAYWAGMKDRNNSYTCNVTFTDNNTVSLSGNRQVIIYGIP